MPKLTIPFQIPQRDLDKLEMTAEEFVQNAQALLQEFVDDEKANREFENRLKRGPQ